MLYKVLGIDPGNVNCGWFYFYYLSLKKKFENKFDLREAEYGHDNLDKIRDLITEIQPDKVVIEDIVIYKKMNTIDALATARVIGRIEEICATYDIEVVRIDRPTVIKLITGRRPGRGHKISKADLQNKIKELLHLEGVIKPQHANDALAVAVASYIKASSNAGRTSRPIQKTIRESEQDK